MRFHICIYICIYNCNQIMIFSNGFVVKMGVVCSNKVVMDLSGRCLLGTIKIIECHYT